MLLVLLLELWTIERLLVLSGLLVWLDWKVTIAFIRSRRRV